MRVDLANYNPADTGDDDDEKLKLAAWAELANRNDGVYERQQTVDLPQMDITAERKPVAHMTTADFADGPQPPAERIAAPEAADNTPPPSAAAEPTQAAAAPAAKFDDAPAPPKLAADAPATAKLGEALSQPEAKKEHYFFGDSNAASPWAILADLALNRGRGVGGILALGGEEASKAPEHQAELDLKKAQAERMRALAAGKITDPTTLALKQAQFALQQEAEKRKQEQGDERIKLSQSGQQGLQGRFDTHRTDQIDPNSQFNTTQVAQAGLKAEASTAGRLDTEHKFNERTAVDKAAVAGAEAGARIEAGHDYAPVTRADAAAQAGAVAAASQEGAEPGRLDYEAKLNPILKDRNNNGVGAGLSAEQFIKDNPDIDWRDPQQLQNALKSRMVNQKTIDKTDAANRGRGIVQGLHDVASAYDSMSPTQRASPDGYQMMKAYDGLADEYAGVMQKLGGEASQAAKARALAQVPSLHLPHDYLMKGVEGLWTPIETNTAGTLQSLGGSPKAPRFIQEKQAQQAQQQPPAAAVPPPSAAGDSLPVTQGTPPRMPSDATRGSQQKTQRRVTKPDGKVVMYPLNDEEAAKLAAKGFKVD